MQYVRSSISTKSGRAPAWLIPDVYKRQDVIPLIIWTSMRNRVGHRLYERRRDTRLKVKFEFAADTAHTISDHLYWNNAVGRLTSK